MRSLLKKIKIGVSTATPLLFLAACGSSGNAPSAGYYGDPSQSYVMKQKSFKPYEVKGKWYYPSHGNGYNEVGIASWYGDYFHGRPTATGETYDMNGLSAAHKTLPLPSWVRVTNLENGQSAYVKVNDRGPFVDGRIIDLSKGAALALGTYNKGLGRVRVEAAAPPTNVVLITPDGQRITGSAHAGASPVQVKTASKNNAAPVVSQSAADGMPLYKGGGAQTYTREILLSGLRNKGAQTPYVAAPVQYASAPENSVYSAPVSNLNTLPRSDVGKTSYTAPSGYDMQGYRVQVGAFSSLQNAETLKNRISVLGDARADPVRTVNGSTFHRVTLNGYKSYAEAGQAAESLRQYGIHDAKILTK